MESWRIERLSRSHERDEFSCGREALDVFLRSLVSQYEKRDLGRTYVAVRPGERRVLGYYTLASGAVSFQSLPTGAARKLPKHPVPVALLARLAIDRAAQGRGLGGMLLADALRRCSGFADELGIHAVEVHALDDAAEAFYKHYGFIPLLDQARHLYLPLATVRQVLG
jgi:GNAT superfamily N-acetyltransferase